MDSKTNIQLGKDQIKWLEKYNYINLNQWRIGPIGNTELIKEKKEKKNDLDDLWMYVGDWKPDKNKSDSGYLERYYNLENDRYFYWPK